MAICVCVAVGAFLAFRVFGTGSAVTPPPRSAAAGLSRAPVGEGAERSGRVVRVRDGDSLVVRIGGIGTEVRLDGVDCPELAQAYGRSAKRFTADLAFGHEVRLLAKGLDKYNRELAEVLLPDGRSLNRELVSAGYAWWFRRHSSDRDLEERERQARAARRGLWADPNPVPPWDFREAHPAAERRR